jgi:hypothetical protein
VLSNPISIQIPLCFVLGDGRRRIVRVPISMMEFTELNWTGKSARLFRHGLDREGSVPDLYRRLPQLFLYPQLDFLLGWCSSPHNLHGRLGLGVAVAAASFAPPVLPPLLELVGSCRSSAIFNHLNKRKSAYTQ